MLITYLTIQTCNYSARDPYLTSDFHLCNYGRNFDRFRPSEITIAFFPTLNN